MKLKQLEVSLSKEERRTVDEYGNTASTWARIGITVDLDKGDDLKACIQQLKAEIQPEVDDWLLRQGGYTLPPADAEGTHSALPELEERLSDLFQTEVKVHEVPTAKEVSPDGDAAGDEIPL